MQIACQIREKLYFTLFNVQARKKEKNIYSNILTRNEKIGVRYKNILPNSGSMYLLAAGYQHD